MPCRQRYVVVKSLLYYTNSRTLFYNRAYNLFFKVPWKLEVRSTFTWFWRGIRVNIHNFSANLMRKILPFKLECDGDHFFFISQPIWKERTKTALVCWKVGSCTTVTLPNGIHFSCKHYRIQTNYEAIKSIWKAISHAFKLLTRPLFVTIGFYLNWNSNIFIFILF